LLSRRRVFGFRLFLAVSIATATTTLAAPRAHAFDSLRECVPPESFLLIAWRSAPERGYIDRELADVRDALRASDFLDRVIAEAQASSPPADAADGEPEGFELEWWRDALARVEWWRLVHTEGAIGFRVGPTGRIELLIALDAGSASARDESLLALREILHGLAAVFETYELVEAPREGVPTTVLYGLEDPGEQICLGGYDDVVLIATSSHLLRQSIELLEGRGSARPLIDTPEYRASRKTLERSLGDSTGIGDFEVWFRPGESLEGERALTAISRWHLLFSDREQRLDWACELELDAADEENFLALAFEDQEPIADLLARVPRDVHSFSVESGARPDLWYRWLVELSSVLSGGPLLADLVQRAQGEARFDLEADLLRHLTGRRLSLVFEEGEAEARRYPEAYVFELAPSPQSKEAVLAQVRRLREAFESFGMPVADVETKRAGDVLFEFDTKAFAGWPLVVGVGSTGLVVATSREAAARAQNLSPDDSADRPLIDPALGPGALPDADSLDEVFSYKDRSGCGRPCALLR